MTWTARLWGQGRLETSAIRAKLIAHDLDEAVRPPEHDPPARPR